MYGPNDAGCWLDGSRGYAIGVQVQKLAVAEGWAGTVELPDSELYDDAWDEAEEFLNENAAPPGFFFGSNENGDWGLWPEVDE